MRSPRPSFILVAMSSSGRIFRTLAVLACLSVFTAGLSGQSAASPAQTATPLPAAAAPASGPALAVLDLENAGLDPRVDYLAGILQGLLAYDLGSVGGITLVDRRNLDSVLKERELSLSALGQDSAAAAAAGKIIGADWMLSGNYVFTGSDVLLTLSLTDTASAKRIVFRDRGSTENLVHHLAEQIVLRLTGRTVTLADDTRSRSLVSLRDETPGSIALHSIIIDAEIFLDGSFVGYTTGDVRTPFVIEKVGPGAHKLRTHLDSSFGVIKLPEVSFGDWEAEVQVEPGQRLVVRDETRQFNELLYALQNLYSETLTAPADNLAPLSVVKELSFQDRKGQEIRVRLEAQPRPLANGGVAVDISLSAAPAAASGAAGGGAVARPAGGATTADGAVAGPAAAEARLSLSRTGGEDEGADEQKADAGIVGLSASLDKSGSSWELELWLERTDIHQNMFRE